MSTATTLPPRWFIRTVWRAHRLLYRVSAGHAGLSEPTQEKAGMLRLRTVGRTSGQERAAIVCFIDDGRDLVTLAMNGWGDTAPAWWLNLVATPDAAVDTVSGTRNVRARAAVSEERDRLWARVSAVQGWGNDLDALAATRSAPTAVVVLEPR
jgi:deazaflavin-dependent oxidoreductase (nitroreductase family)